MFTITFNRHLCSQLLNLALSFLLLFLSSLAFLALLWLVSRQSSSELFERGLFFDPLGDLDIEDVVCMCRQNYGQCLQPYIQIFEIMKLPAITAMDSNLFIVLTIV